MVKRLELFADTYASGAKFFYELLRGGDSGGRAFDAEKNPLEINLFLAKNDNTNSMKETLVNMLTHSFIQQKYQFHFRIREQTLFEDILADEFVASLKEKAG